MAERRMFAKTIIDSDAFLEMPLSTQALYFHLSMRADDDGFINNPKKIQRMIGASDDDGKLLVMKKFIIPFDSGVVVIKHWKIHNYIQKDRYKETMYKEEKAQLETKENKAYKLTEKPCIQNVYNMDTQVRLGKDRLEIELDKDSIEEDESSTTPTPSKPIKKKSSKHKHGEYQNILLTDEELEKLKNEYPNYEEAIEYLDEYIEMTGKKYKSHYLAMKKWVFSALEERQRKSQSNQRKFTKTVPVVPIPKWLEEQKLKEAESEKPKERDGWTDEEKYERMYKAQMMFGQKEDAEETKQKYFELTGKNIDDVVGHIEEFVE